MKEVVAIEQAQDEINVWLESRKLTPSQIDAQQDSIKILVEGIQYGMLTLKDGCFKQSLLFPVGKDECVKELQYTSRINHLLLHPYMKGTKGDDGDERLLSYLECLTDKTPLISRQHLKTLDTQDKRVAMSIVVFFVS